MENDDIGRYYERARAKIRELSNELAALKGAEPRDEDAVRRCEERLERARVVD